MAAAALGDASAEQKQEKALLQDKVSLVRLPACTTEWSLLSVPNVESLGCKMDRCCLHVCFVYMPSSNCRCVARYVPAAAAVSWFTYVACKSLQLVQATPNPDILQVHQATVDQDVMFLAGWLAALKLSGLDAPSVACWLCTFLPPSGMTWRHISTEVTPHQLLLCQQLVLGEGQVLPDGVKQGKTYCSAGSPVVGPLIEAALHTSKCDAQAAVHHAACVHCPLKSVAGEGASS